MNKIPKYHLCPDDNELAKFIEGKLSGEPLRHIKKHLETCRLCNQTVRLALELAAMGSEINAKAEVSEIITGFAARADRKLCVLYTEQYILQQFGIIVNIDDMLSIAKQNRWIKHQGVQFKNIGKLLEYYAVNVERVTHATLYDLKTALEQGHWVMVGIDAGELFANTPLKKVAEKIEDWFDEQADHVLLVTRVIQKTDAEGEIEVLNIDAGKATPFKTSVSRFLNAWKDSGNFMVEVKI